MQTWVGKLVGDFGTALSRTWEFLVHVDPGEFLGFFFMAIFTFLLLISGYAILNSVVATDRVTFCEIHSELDRSYAGTKQYFNVVGHKDWRADVFIGKTENLEIALALTKEAVCNPQ